MWSTRTLWLAVTAVVAVILLLLPPVRMAAACSKAAVWGYRRANDLIFIGSAGGDTALAGQGSVDYRTGEGHFGRGSARTIYGQVIRVERTTLIVPAAVRRALPRGAGEVVLVPWDYDPACTPVPWSGSARWVPEGSRGLFRGSLRPSHQWAGGRPTLDVHTPQYEPYPIAQGLRARLAALRRGPGFDSILTAEELLDVFDQIPVQSEPPDETRPDTNDLMRWARQHPTLAARYPANDIIRMALFQADSRRVRAMRSPVAGTYRVVMTLPSADSVVLYFRTEATATSRLEDDRPRSRRPREPQPIGRAVGYYVLGQTAATERKLPVKREHSNRSLQAYLALIEQPVIEHADSTVWRGSMDLVPEAATLAASSGHAEALRRAKSFMHLESFAPGRFVLTTDGRVRFSLDILAGDSTLLSIRADRISTRMLDDRRSGFPPR